jgi:hypothetical protein
MKNKNLKRTMEQAASMCSGSGLRSVREHISKALRELERIESKNENEERRQWKLDLSTGTLTNMSGNQAREALKRIDGMISAESSKIKTKDLPDSFLTD